MATGSNRLSFYFHLAESRGRDVSELQSVSPCVRAPTGLITPWRLCCVVIVTFPLRVGWTTPATCRHCPSPRRVATSTPSPTFWPAPRSSCGRPKRDFRRKSLRPRCTARRPRSREPSAGGANSPRSITWCSTAATPPPRRHASRPRCLRLRRLSQRNLRRSARPRHLHPSPRRLHPSPLHPQCNLL